MEKKSSVSDSPGEAQNKQTFTLEQVREMIKKDTQTAILMLEAIYRDQNTLEAIADYLHGRYMNTKHKEELDKQTKLDV